MSSSVSVSVVIPCYNGERFIADAVRSALTQTVLPLEIIVIDDGSTDGTVEAVRSIDSPIVSVVSQTNQGESAARNHGISLAKGDWVGFLDADDIWVPEKLERQFARLHESDSDRVICVHSSYYNFGDVDTLPDIPASALAGFDLVEHLCAPYIRTSSALVRRSAPARFPEWTRRGEDTFYFAELSLYGVLKFVPDRLVGYRRSSSQQTREAEHFAEYHNSLLRWLASHEQQLAAATREQIERRLMDDMFGRLEVYKWRRDWPRYWKLREHLREIATSSSRDAHLNERIYPPLLYRIKDWLEQVVRAS